MTIVDGWMDDGSNRMIVKRTCFWKRKKKPKNFDVWIKKMMLWLWFFLLCVTVIWSIGGRMIRIRERSFLWKWSHLVTMYQVSRKTWFRHTHAKKKALRCAVGRWRCCCWWWFCLFSFRCWGKIRSFYLPYFLISFCQDRSFTRMVSRFAWKKEKHWTKKKKIRSIRYGQRTTEYEVLQYVCGFNSVRTVGFVVTYIFITGT